MFIQYILPLSVYEDLKISYSSIPLVISNSGVLYRILL